MVFVAMPMKPLVIAALCLSACFSDGVYVIPEAQAVAIVRDVLETRGVDAGPTDRRVEGLSVCVDGAPCRTIALALDGWDDALRIGFAYVSDADRGLPSSMAIERDEAEAMQTQLDARRDTEGLIVVFREWGHENEYLATEQFQRAVETALDERGLVDP